jgi:hypothetical protein
MFLLTLHYYIVMIHKKGDIINANH